MVLKRIGVWSVARIAALLYASIGLIAGLFLAAFSTIASGIMAAAATNGEVPAWVGLLFGAGAIVILPIFYGVMGLILGAIWAGLYNLFAKLVGGVVLELQ